ncbi:response regulator [Massilia yuzhufengensis]|uniref:Two-component system, chemotaxis family, response regulator CheY n=1 Tax=Massilia yuzhufengensis TaxID=1164594 RepID=A0A1I1RND9_9BURK|nr:response regulator [Massilia yuzhufengensis]SFD35866.1 two-component system, chemotaxis family, response regulator CheY [Massilia yuzhufengensis]
MLKAVIVDGSAISRGLLNTVLTDGGYEVVGQTHTGLLGHGLAMKHRAQIVCVAREQVEDGSRVVEELRAHLPKAMIFMVSGTLDAPAIQEALGRGVHGFIVKPFKADTVLKTIRNTVIAIVKKQQAAGAPD